MAGTYETAKLARSRRYQRGKSTTIFEAAEFPWKVFKRVDRLWDRLEPITSYDEAQFYQDVGWGLRLLQSRLSHYIPQTELIWRRDPDALSTYAGFIVMDEVVGTPVSQLDDITPEMAVQLDDLLAISLTLARSFQQPNLKGAITTDMANQREGIINIVWGTTQNNPIPQFYIIDIYVALSLNEHARRDWCSALGGLTLRASGYMFPRASQALDKLLTESGS